ncbi:hypothetical protein G7051_17545 [Dysgonomonas sp. HDW5B]|uniref:MAC/perforin domain-containing protein n=1 Tax=Dysgonomonas sp. HDW5B TaxID=2714927 RepID=UPI00140A1C8D|nr:MAC/perforin domain-containing protein [Dysgonomonas sp. HDW5B]QIK56065.1 hypothetical protein G7051_17545 [Dysgonomonas sp. HDW5B]
MKKNYLFLIFILGLFSCSEDRLLNNQDDSEVSNLTLRTAGDGIYDVLGYGYDITDEYMGETAVKRQVVNIKAFLDAGNMYKFDNPLVAIITDNTYLGENATAMTKDIMKKTNFNGSVAAFPDDSRAKDSETAFFSGSVTKNSTSNYSYSSKFSFARADLLKKHRHLFVDSSPLDLSKYLHQQFTEDLKSLTADQIVIKYGTHVMTDITIGGFYKAVYNSSIIEETSSSTKSKTVEAGLKVNLGVVGLSLGGSTTTTETTTLNQKNVNWSCNIITVGGTNNGHTITLSPGNASSITLNKTEWAKSVDDKNSKLVELNWNATYPIYHFITDPTKKAQIKDAVQRYIASKKLKVVEVKPMHQLKSRKTGDTWYVFTKAEVDYAVSKWNEQYGGIVGYVLANPDPNTKPMYQLKSRNTGDTWYVYTKAEADYAVSKWNDIYGGIIAYVLVNSEPNTSPMHRLRSRNTGDTWYAFTKAEVDYAISKWNEQYGGIDGYIYNP